MLLPIVTSLKRWNLFQRVGVIMRSAEGVWKYIGHRHELGDFFWVRSGHNQPCRPVHRALRWIMPSSRRSSLSSPLLPKLRNLLVADVLSSWDASCPRLLLEMAPSLQTIHVHVAPCKEKPGDKISWKRSRLRHHCLKEFVVAGFEGTERQICLVRFVI